MAAIFNNPERLPPARVLRRTLVVGKKPLSSFRQRDAARIIATQITDCMTKQTADLNRMVEETAQEAAKGLATDIRKGRLKVEPNATEYKAWKARTGKSENPLISTGAYAKAIVAEEVRPGLHRVTVKSGKHRPSGMTFARLSRTLEEGTLDGIPARPHFAKAAKKARQRLKERLARYTTEQDKAAAVHKNRKQRLRP